MIETPERFQARKSGDPTRGGSAIAKESNSKRRYGTRSLWIAARSCQSGRTFYGRFTNVRFRCSHTPTITMPGTDPYHVLGSQGLSRARRGIKSSLERERYLRKIMKRVEEGHKKYPREAELEQLLEDLKKEYMTIAVNPKSAT